MADSNPIILTVSIDRESGQVTMVTNVQAPQDLRKLYDALQVVSNSLVDNMLATPAKTVEAA